MAEVKFCGLTRPGDAAFATSLGAAYVGVIFAGGPRQLDVTTARAVLDGARTAHDESPRRVGVFAAQSLDEIAAVASEARLDVVQLHGRSDAPLVDGLRRRFAGQIWRVVRVGDLLRDDALRLAANGVDAVLVDALVPGLLGGSGAAVDWPRLRAAMDAGGRPPRLVLAGGLHAENVEQAVGLVAPDVVDVSSGIETAPGIKDHQKMRAFAAAAARGGR